MDVRSLRSDRAEHVFGRCVAILFELLSDDSRFLCKAFRKEESILKNLGTTSPVLEGEEREKLWQVDGTLYLDQHQTGVITTTSYAGAGSSVGRCQPKILNVSKSLTPRAITVLESGDRDRSWDSRLLTSVEIIQRDDGVGGGISTVQITGGGDNLSNHPGASDPTAAAEQPTSDGSNAEERLVPAAGNALKSTHGLVA
ncbi:hypothetical protein F2Q69_00014782 [Brassica cretica]|uniref:Uncharacterized protein n=1 Tax=Brassica cretica TaxID=69181 RepID=A0A8S9QX25_BRACR|nr:hypothetical protein F2Q69_00014782 [Brassica cretica]